jgi:hypothetical protein
MCSTYLSPAESSILSCSFDHSFGIFHPCLIQRAHQAFEDLPAFGLFQVQRGVELVSALRQIVKAFAFVEHTVRSAGSDEIVEGKIAQQRGVGQGVIREALIELEHQAMTIKIGFLPLTSRRALKKRAKQRVIF